MGSNELHDLLEQLRDQHKGADFVDSEYQQRLDDIIVSLEKQSLYPDSFDEYSNLDEQIGALILDLETEYPTLKRVLDSIQQVLSNFRV